MIIFVSILRIISHFRLSPTSCATRISRKYRKEVVDARCISLKSTLSHGEGVAGRCSWKQVVSLRWIGVKDQEKCEDCGLWAMGREWISAGQHGRSVTIGGKLKWGNFSKLCVPLERLLEL